jgi:aryl-alcohol dehydrogenase-like predicted oxidoreductase
VGRYFDHKKKDSRPMFERIILGTAQFGFKYGIANETGQVLPEVVESILSEAVTHGIKILDTAISYGDSESVLGALGVADWKIVTKLPPIPVDCGDVIFWAVDQIERSLARLGVNHIYGLLFHRPSELLGNHGRSLIDAQAFLKKWGLVQKIGVSVYAPEELTALTNIMPIELVQMPLNIIDRRLVESGWARRLKRDGVDVHVRSVFLQGLLLMPPSRRPIQFRRWAPFWEIWDDWLRDTGQTPLQACIRYALSVDHVDHVVVGIDSVNQLREILRAAQGSIGELPTWPQPPDPDLINPARWSLL